MPKSQFLTSRVWITPFLLIVSILCSAQAPLPEPVTDQETELGLAVYNELKEKVEIVESSPLYESMRPVTEAISRVAQSRYNHPFKFFLVHEAQPNAFATPGGNVYVVDSLLYFVKDTEQLAGTLCHEVSHTIHRDSMNRIKETEKIALGNIGVQIGLNLAKTAGLSLKCCSSVFILVPLAGWSDKSWGMCFVSAFWNA